MSARVESPSIGRFNAGAVVIAIVLALGVGGLAGMMVTRATEGPRAVVTTPVGAQFWDAQKLEAMQGRQLAEQVGIAVPQLWDQHKLDAMQGRQLAELTRVEAADEPPVAVAHLPKRG